MQDIAMSVDECLAAVSCATDRGAIIRSLRRYGLTTLADRLDHLIELEVDDPDGLPMSLASLQYAAAFLLRMTHAPTPGIAVDQDGHIGFDWRLEPVGIVASTFLANGNVVYAGSVSRQPGLDERRRESGVCELDAAVSVVGGLLEQPSES